VVKVLQPVVRVVPAQEGAAHAAVHHVVPGRVGQGNQRAQRGRVMGFMSCMGVLMGFMATKVGCPLGDAVQNGN
jgi:hypothetical protein